MTPSKFDQEAQRLSKLPRAERFDELLDFPTEFTFKVIGRGKGFFQAVRSVLDGLGHANVILVERPSAKGRYSSVSFSLVVESGAMIDSTYRALEALPELILLL